MTELIETTYTENKDMPVVIVCHSMGCLYSLYFFNQKEQAWKDKYIRTWITLAAPFGGATEALLSMISGYNFDIVIYNATTFRPMQQTFSSLTFLLPNPEIFGETTILTHNDRNYTAADMPEIIELTNSTSIYQMWLQSKDLLSYEHPGVEIHCIYGKSVKTHSASVFDDEYLFPNKPNILKGDGDGTVNLVSASTCERWRKTSKERGLNFTSTIFDGIIHRNLVRDVKVVDHVVSILNDLK